jgi:hypothetical protein
MKWTFNAWYALVVAHMWMLFVRLRRDGRAGQDLAQDLFDSFWRDSESRMIQLKVKREEGLYCLTIPNIISPVNIIHYNKILQISNPITLSRATKFYARVYYGSVVAYDESLNPVHSDMILSDALWRCEQHIKHEGFY